MSDETTPHNAEPPKPNASATVDPQAPSAVSDPDAAAAPFPDIGPEQLKAMIAALQEQLDATSAEVADKHDQYVRAVAETENVRRRLEREKEETGRYAIGKFAKDILSVGDNFQRAIGAVPADAIDNDPALKTLVDGVAMAEREFRQIIERHGVKAIDPAGLPFNPHQHQAVVEQDDPSVPTGTVVKVFMTGYMLDDRCLRPAMVVVSRGGPKPGAQPQPDAPPTDTSSTPENGA
jgi:molecular chaperone GrpE